MRYISQKSQALCDHQYQMAKQGKKWAYGDKFGRENNRKGSFQLYHNQIAPLNITLFAESKTLKGVYTIYDDPNFMFSGDKTIYQYTYDWMQKLKVKCIPISEDNERHRMAYFNVLRSSITKDYE